MAASGWSIAGAGLLFLHAALCGCKENSAPSVTQPAEGPGAPATTDRPADAREPSTTTKTVLTPRKPTDTPEKPRRPVPSWAVFREPFDEKRDADCLARWTGDRRLEIQTENIRLLTLDLNKLPREAPRDGPWNLQIDSQGIYITGLRGDVRVLDLVRSQNGDWTVVPRSHRLRP